MKQVSGARATSPESRRDPAAILTTAAKRAARILQLSQKDLGRIVGLSEASASRLFAGRRSVSLDTKEGELAVLFVRMFRSLDALFGGNEENARAWLHAENSHLAGVPAELIQTVTGLVNVIEYLDAMRGRV